MKSSVLLTQISNHGEGATVDKDSAFQKISAAAVCRYIGAKRSMALSDLNADVCTADPEKLVVSFLVFVTAATAWLLFVTRKCSVWAINSLSTG